LSESFGVFYALYSLFSSINTQSWHRRRKEQQQQQQQQQQRKGSTRKRGTAGSALSGTNKPDPLMTALAPVHHSHRMQV
jgi:hypothetical protein